LLYLFMIFVGPFIVVEVWALTPLEMRVFLVDAFLLFLVGVMFYKIVRFLYDFRHRY